MSGDTKCGSAQMERKHTGKLGLPAMPMAWWVGCMLMFLAWLLTPTILQVVYGKNQETGMGAFADSYGFVTSLFTVAATMLVLAGLIMQRRELDQLQEALSQQASESEKLNSLTRQQMGFAELQARIAALPSLELRHDIISQYNENTGCYEDNEYLYLINNGAAVYDVSLRVDAIYEYGEPQLRPHWKWHKARLDTTNKFEQFVEIPPGGWAVGEITWVTSLAEPFVEDFHIHHGSTSVVTNFTDEAATIRQSVEREYGRLLSIR